MAKVVQAQVAEAPELTRSRWLAFTKQFRRLGLPRIVLIGMCAIYLFPFYWMIVIALKTNAELSLYPPTFFPHNLRWSNFADAVDVFPFWTFLKNTSIITALTVIGSAISNPIVAYGFSRIEWPGRDKIFALVLATVFIPYPVLIIALFDIFANLPRPMFHMWGVDFGGNWINTILPLVVPLFFGNAFWIFLMRQFLMQIPQEISDAARIDGASELRILFQIIMPQSLPAISVICIFAALHAWNDFLGPLLYLTGTENYTLAIGLTFFQSQSQYDIQYNLLMAASILVVLPVIVLFLAFQRFFVEGVTVGSFK
ncbi:MAG: carbohydrate ABC transporter permease [Thermomicrobiales bacterium]